MIKRKKIIFNILAIFNLVFLFYFSFKNNLLESNLSRISNSSKEGYFLFIIYCLLFGLMMFLVLRKQYLYKLSYVGIISLLVGGIVPYNYLNVGSLSSNLHLIGAYLSIILTCICLLYSVFYFSVHYNRFGNILKTGVLVVALIVFYLYGTYGFINTLAELVYLSYIIISELIIYNVL